MNPTLIKVGDGSDYPYSLRPNGVTFEEIREQINYDFTLDPLPATWSLLISPQTGFAAGAFGSITYTIGFAYLDPDNNNELTTGTLGVPQYTTYTYYDDTVAPGDTTPPVITPISGNEIVIQEDIYSTSTQFINAFFTITDPQSGVVSFGLEPNIDFQTPRARGLVQVRATNGDGYTSFYPFYLTITAIDTIPPTITASETNLTFYKSSYPNFVSALVIDQAISSITTIADNTNLVSRSYSPALSQWSPSSFPAQRIYEVFALDSAGNYSSEPVYITLQYIDDTTVIPDTEAPTILIKQTTFNIFSSVYPNGITATQLRTLVLAQVEAEDNIGVVGYTFNPSLQNIVEYGSYSYQVRAFDAANNVSPWVNFTVNHINENPDTTAPIIYGDSVINIFVGDNRNFAYILGFYTLWDDSGIVSWYNTPSITFNTVGSFAFTLQAIDGDGNIGSKNITVNVLSGTQPTDTTPPTITGAYETTVYTGDGLTANSFIETYYTISDPSGITQRFLSPSVPFNTAGTYFTAIYAIDGANNVATKNIKINVIQGVNPNLPTAPGGEIIEDIYIGDELVTNKVKLGFTLSDKIDVELDSATIILPYSTRNEPYRPFTLVKFYIKDVADPITYYLTDDSVARVSSATPLFQHSIVLIEPTKILERFKCVDMTFTQPIDNTFGSYTLLDVVNRISNNNPSRRANDLTVYWDTVETELSNLLASVKAPQLQFRSMTVREALDRALQFINAVARLKILDDGTRVLSADFFNTLDTLTQLESVINLSKAQGSEFFADNSELTVENATAEYATVNFPAQGWAGVRANEALINSENYRIELPFPIYEIKSVQLFLRVYTQDTANNVSTVEYKIVDITPFVFERQLYQALPSGTPARQVNKEKHSYNTLYYSRGDHFIYNLQNIGSINAIGFDVDRTIDLILDSIYGGSGKTVKWEGLKYSDLLFRIEYRTILSSRLRFMRDVKEDFFGTIHTNQMENIVDIEALGANARGVINRVGNPDLTVSKVVKTWNNRFKVGQFTEDGYIATQVENAIFNDHIRSTASFTKNYNGLSKFVGVDTEIRQIPIPLQTIKSTVHYDQFGIFDTTLYPLATVQNFAQDRLIDIIGDYLKQYPDKDFSDVFTVQANNRDTAAEFITPNFLGLKTITLTTNIPLNGSYPTNIIIYDENDVVIYSITGLITTQPPFNITVAFEPNKRYKLVVVRDSSQTASVKLDINYIPVSQFGKYMIKFSTYTTQGGLLAKVLATPDIGAVNNSLKIDFGFNDNLSAGFKIVENYSGQLTGQQKAFYTDTIGRFGFYDFTVAEMVEPSADADKITLANRLPTVVDNDFQNAILISGLMRHLKDNTENFAMTYQLHHLVSDTNQNHIVVGKKFLTKLLKADNLNDMKFKLYISNTETYTRFENDKAKGTMNTSDEAYTITPIYSGGRAIKIEINLSLTGAKSFAIGTENGDLVLGFNQIHPYTGQYKNLTTIYLNFTDKRS